MKNEFIEYLNSMNNADGDSMNALAESQVTNKYYHYIRVNRKLGKFITEKLKKNEKHCYIMTGHAGDGKTSVLIQILNELNMLENGEKLEKSDMKSKNGIELFYVKDMSELTSDDQEKLLNKCLNMPKQNKSSILISNTGPLIKAFKKLSSENKEEVIEDILLKQLDNNECSEIEIEGYKFYLINIAKIENIGIVRGLFNNICSANLWDKCINCNNKEKCPIYFNKQCVSSNKNRVIEFIEMYYRWLGENDKKITVRQMISQISFSFTANLSCEVISKFEKNNFNLFKYNFANLFFGYRGIAKIEECNQIKPIYMIQNLKLDNIALEEDYNLFVKEEFEYFDIKIINVLKEIWKKFDRSISFEENDSNDSFSFVKRKKMRKAIRRFFLVYGQSDKQKIYDILYGNGFMTYIEATTNSVSNIKLKKISKKIFDALYIKNIGLPCKEKEENLYLTLRRDDETFQGALLLLAKIDKDELKVKQVKKNIEIEDIEEAFSLELEIKSEKFKISLPLFLYFNSIVNGKISTQLNPSLSHGLTELNALLLKCFRNKNNGNGNEFSIIVNTSSGIEQIDLEISDEKIYFE